ncbi:MAG: GNAT family N-acetyltransferase [Ardenticatenaceae bacterium]|nr:GNAT family N-acetyltransferase [Ardenticatenaceae bacterium]
MKIRQAVKKDGAEIGQLLREMGWFSGLAAETPAQTEARIARLLADVSVVESHSVYVAEEAGRVVGYTAVHWLPYLFMTGPEGFVSELFVRETVRGQGVGRQLLAAVETEARQRGCTRLSLLNGRHRESYQRQFYEKMGWEERPFMANFVYYFVE